MSVQVVIQEKERIAVQEERELAGGIFLLAAGIVTLKSLNDYWKTAAHDWDLILILSLVWLLWATLATLAFVESTITIERRRELLIIHRSLFGLKLKREYSLAEAKRIWVEEGLRGSPIYLELASGSKRQLTLWAHRENCREVTALNSFL